MRQQLQDIWAHENLHTHYSIGLGDLNYAIGQHALFGSVQYVLELRILQQSHLVCCNPCQSQRHFSSYGIDFMTNLPETKEGYNTIMTVTEHLIKHM